MCDKLDGRDKTYMINDLANSIKCLGARPESIQPELAKNYDGTVKRLLDKINKLVEEV